MNRRDLLLRTLLCCAAAPLLWGHTPYRQWQVYRRKHLLIGTSRADPGSFALGRRLADLLARELPESRARAARAPDAWRLASLLATGQLPSALFTARAAADLAAGRGAFGGLGSPPLRALCGLGDHWLLTLDDFPAWQAWLVAGTLARHASNPPARLPGARPAPVPAHPGAAAYAAGQPMPPAPTP